MVAPAGSTAIRTEVVDGRDSRGTATIAISASRSAIAADSPITTPRGARGGWARRSTGWLAPCGKSRDGPAASRPAASIFSTK
jgi:hypothetical protein